MLLIVPFWGALLFTEAFSVKHYDDNSQDEHYEGSGRVRRSRGAAKISAANDPTARSAAVQRGFAPRPAPLCWRAFMLSPLV